MNEIPKNVPKETRLTQNSNWFSLAGQMKQQSVNHFTNDAHHKSKQVKNSPESNYFDFENQSL